MRQQGHETVEQVGSISAVCGRLTAVDAVGCARQLGLHDPVFEGDTLIAALDSAASVRLVTGVDLYLPPGSTAMLDTDVFDHDDLIEDGGLRLHDLLRVLDLLSQPARRSVA
jgi:hypothetical protein